MKTFILSLALTAFMVFPMTLNAQSPLDKLVDKYTGQEGFTTVNISKEMFQMFQQMAKGDAADSNALEVKKMMEQLSSLKVLTFNFDSVKVAKAVSVYNEFAGLFPASAYKELMTINEGRQAIRFLTKQDAAGMISEMVMLMKDKNEVMVLSITGSIDLSTISKLSKGMNIQGMQNLNKIKSHPGGK